MDYVKILEWETFQHYSKRSPPWIKLYNSLLDNEKFECLQDDSKVLLFCLWMLTSRKGNGKVPANPKYLYKHLPLSKKPNLQPLIQNGFIVICKQDDSKMIAEGNQDATPETEQRQSRVETKQKYMEFVFLSSEEYKKLVSQFGEQGTTEKIKALNDYIGSKGKKYKSHYHTILMWERKNEQPKRETTHEQFERLRKAGEL